MQASALSSNSLKLRLRHVDAFYSFCDETYGMDTFDAAISARDAGLVSQMVEAFFHHLTSVPDYKTTTVQRWETVRTFVQYLARLRAPASPDWSALSSFLFGIGKIRMPLSGRVRFIRALPAETLADLLDVAHFQSDRNPFKSGNRVRNWLALNLMLLAGLRRGEVLILSVDSLKREFDPKHQRTRYYLVVKESQEHDPRTNTPSIKTERSHRRVPVSKSLADLWDHYLEEHRCGSEEHSFLLTSRKGRPWAAESLADMVALLSGALSQSARDKLFNVTGGKEAVSAHDFRHTCATVRYRQWIAQPDMSKELAMQHMRAFFGWSYGSTMPEHYARAAIEEDLAARWDELFDTRLNLLRSLAK